MTFTVSFPSHIGPENLILRNPPRCERNKKEYEALESFEDSLRLIWSRNDELLEALDEIDSQASTTSKREKAAYEKAMLEARSKAPSRGRGKKRLVGTAERAAIDSATKAKEQCREDHYREIISSYGLSSTEDLVDTLKTQIEKLLDLNSSSEEIVEALRESDAVTSACNKFLYLNFHKRL